MIDRYIDNSIFLRVMLIEMKRASIAASMAMGMLEYIEILKDHTKDPMSTALHANEPEDGRI